MVLHGVRTYAHAFRDPAVREPMANLFRDPPLCRGQHVIVRRPSSRAPGHIQFLVNVGQNFPTRWRMWQERRDIRLSLATC
jgi:hypothetical protein